jgi:3D (Asp-Asp-Asp) domain-containing protein
MGWHSLRMTVTLALHAVPGRLVSEYHRLKRRVTPRRLVAGGVLAALILTPAILYVLERSHHEATRRAYRALAMNAGAENAFLARSVRDLLYDQALTTRLLLEDGFTVHTGDNVTVKVVATGYSSSVWETDATPFITAANTRTRMGVVALSRDLLSRYTPTAPFDFGDRVHISGLGYFIVEDSMNRRWDNRADIWFESAQQARNFGIRDVYMTLVSERSDDVTSGKSGSVAVSGL